MLQQLKCAPSRNCLQPPGMSGLQAKPGIYSQCVPLTLEIIPGQKPTFLRILFIFKFDYSPYTLKDTAGQILPNYKGPKIRDHQACPTKGGELAQW